MAAGVEAGYAPKSSGNIGDFSIGKGMDIS
jgi:hypothetical protein